MSYMKDSYELGSTPTIEVTAGEDETASLQLQEATALPITISGFVNSSATGTPPISNAFVSVYDQAGDFVDGSYTDDSGFYSVNIAQAGDYTVRANAPGYSGSDATTVTVATDPVTQNFTLTEYSPDERVIYGVVTNSTTATVLSGAKVSLYDSTDALVAVTTTMNNGEYAIADLENGIYSIVVSADGYSAEKIDNIELSDIRPTAHQDVELTPFVPPTETATISGYIRTDEAPSTPIEAAWVGLYQESTDTLVNTTTSDTDGYYIFTEVPAGSYIVRAKATTNTP